MSKLRYKLSRRNDYLHLLVMNSSNTLTHESVKNNLLEAYIAKRDEYPDSKTDAIALLNKYDERKPPPTVASEGTAFAQKGKKKGDKKKKDDKDKDEDSNKKDMDKLSIYLKQEGSLRE